MASPPSQERSALRLMLSNPVFANILMIICLSGMLIGSFFMVKESFPDFGLDMINVTVIYPGATPDEIEEGILLPIEDALEGIQGVKRIYSTAAEGMATTVVEARDGEDLQALKEEVSTRVDTITIFPEQAERPVIEEIKFKAIVINLALWGDLPERQLKELAQQIREDLLALPEVSQVTLSGIRDYEVAIELSEQRLRQLNLTFAQVAAAVEQGSLNLPAGSIRTSSEEFKIRALGRRYWAEEFDDVVVVTRPNGATVYLRDIATIRDRFDDEAHSFARFNGEPAVNIVVEKTSSEDSIEIAEAVYKFVQEVKPTLPPTVELTPWFDNARLIQDRISLLTNNGVVGLGLVFLCLWFFLSLRLGFWVTLGIPISLGGAMVIMALTGQSINMISLFGMIMVLGIIVDDAIVVGESIFAKHEEGLTGLEAAVAGTREVIWPVLAAVCTTIVAFTPLFFVSGIMGKFIGVLPGPVIAALFISLFEALLILPVHLRHGKKQTERRKFSILHFHSFVVTWVGKGLNWLIERLYGPGMDVLLRWRYATISMAFVILLLMVGLIRGGFVEREFFPSSDDDFLRVRVELPQGVPISESDRVARQLLRGWEATAAHYEQQLAEPLAIGVFSVTGGTVGLADEPPMSGNHLVELFIELIPAESRNIFYEDILARWRSETGAIQGAVSTSFEGLGGGPPGDNVSVDLLGDDDQRLAAASRALQQELQEFQGVYDISSTRKPGKRELRLKLLPEAHHLGLTLRDVALQVRHGFYGAEALRIQRGRDEVKVMIRYDEEQRQSLAQLDTMRIRTPSGEEVPFYQVAEVAREEGFATIRRQDRNRVVGVTAEVDDSGNAADITDVVLAEILPRLEREYRITGRRGYDAQMRKDSVVSMAIGAVVALVVIYLIMATIFRSYVQPAIIMVAIPLGLIGAFVGHWLYGKPLSMMSFFGMVALTGIVVNDAIVLIVAINDRLRSGMPFFEALREGGKRRFRAILLTTMTTFAGLFPIILERSFQAQFLIPMALSIAFGVVFATMATLVVIPCLLVALNDLRRLVHLLRHLRWPSREEVEGV